MMSKKLGFDELRAKDGKLIDQFEKTLRTVKPDMTIFYQLLITLRPEGGTEENVVNHFEESFYKEPTDEEKKMLVSLIEAYTERIKTNKTTREESTKLMQSASPRFILRNYLLHQAIEGLENGDDTIFVKLQDAMKQPYSDKYEEFFAKRPSWATQKAGCSMLSCSS
jgi:uncharacterized protein YdiU (UPF0061 family)